MKPSERLELFHQHLRNGILLDARNDHAGAYFAFLDAWCSVLRYGEVFAEAKSVAEKAMRRQKEAFRRSPYTSPPDGFQPSMVSQRRADNVTLEELAQAIAVGDFGEEHLNATAVGLRQDRGVAAEICGILARDGKGRLGVLDATTGKITLVLVNVEPSQVREDLGKVVSLTGKLTGIGAPESGGAMEVTSYHVLDRPEDDIAHALRNGLVICGTGPMLMKHWSARGHGGKSLAAL
jgi:hypothetical protein